MQQLTQEAAEIPIDPKRRWPLLAVAVVAVMVAVAAGIVIGYLVAVDIGLNSSDGWESLGAALFGLLAGLAAGVVAYVVVALAGVVVTMPRRLRLAPAAVLLGWPISFYVLTSFANGVGRSSGVAALIWLCAAVALLVTNVALLWVAGRSIETLWFARSAMLTGGLVVLGVAANLVL